MDTRDIKASFFVDTRRKTSTQYMREVVLHDTEGQGRKRFVRKCLTYVVGTSDIHVLRRPIK